MDSAHHVSTNAYPSPLSDIDTTRCFSLLDYKGIHGVVRGIQQWQGAQVTTFALCKNTHFSADAPGTSSSRVDKCLGTSTMHDDTSSITPYTALQPT